MDFEDRVDVQKWLGRQERQVVVGFAARAALRTIPALGAGFGRSSGSAKNFGNNVVIPVFRAVATSWVESVQPHDFLPPIAGPAASVAYQAGDIASNRQVRAVVASASAACDCAADISVAGSAAYGAVAVYAAGRVFHEVLQAAQYDFENISNGIEASAFSTLRLWQYEPPVPVVKAWSRLKKALRATNEDWDVWIDWYEQRILGGVTNYNLEWERVTLPVEIWSQPSIRINKQIRELLDQHIDITTPAPLENIPSPFAFQLSIQRTIAVRSNPSNSPIFPKETNRREHERLLNVCQTLAQDLIADLKAQKFQVRSEYLQGFEKYTSRLPSRPLHGDILLADAEARTLRHLFAGEAEILDIALAAKLRTFLEQHTGLRVYYPEIANFYRHVQTGKIETALPLDAVDGFIRGVKEYTPAVFDVSVTEAVEGSSAPLPTIDLISKSELPPIDINQPTPPKDPLGEVDQQTARDFTIAGAVNNLWRTFLQGEKVYKTIEGWKKAGDTLRPHVAQILEWLTSFLSGGGGNTPSPPPTFGV